MLYVLGWNTGIDIWEMHMETSGKDLVDHWTWATAKGLMNQNTAGALRAACSQVLGVLDDWETQDIRKLDIDSTLKRFENLRKKDFKPQTLETYKRRFSQAVSSFLSYHDNPASWKPRTQDRSERQERNGIPKRSVEGEQPITFIDQPPSTKLVEYPYPLRVDMIVRISLPRDLNQTEVKRLTKFMESLIMEADGTD
jgi:hypothetical protein